MINKSYKWLSHHWKTRTKIISDFIPAESSVLDLGAGSEHLKNCLKNPTVYKSVDIVKCTEDTVIADFNKNEYPEFKEAFDFVVAQGLIEYIKNPLIFLDQVHKYSDTLIITYLEVASTEAEEKGRVTKITLEELEDFIKKSDWSIENKISYTPQHHVFLCKSYTDNN